MFASASSLSLLVALAAAPGDAPLPGAQVDELRVLQGPKAPRLRVTPLLGFALHNYDQVTANFGGQVEYSPRPDFGLALFGSYLRPSASKPSKELLSNLQLGSEKEAVTTTQMLWAAGLIAHWRPIYGALGWGEDAAARFRVGLGGGIALGQTRTECVNGFPLDPNRGYPKGPSGDTVCNPDDLQSPGTASPRYYEPNTLRPMGVLSLGVDVDMWRHFGLRAEVRDLVFASRVYRPSDSPALTDAIIHRVFFLLGGSFIL